MSGNPVGSLISAAPANIPQQQLGKSSLADIWQGKTKCLQQYLHLAAI